MGKVLACENLAPGGQVIPGNLHPNTSAKEPIDYALKWNLIHRTEEEMNTPVKKSPFGKPCTRIQFEALEINLFADRKGY